MRQLIATFFALTLASFSTVILAADITQQGFMANGDFDLTTRDDGLVLQWNAPEGRAYIDLQFIPRRGNSAAAPLIRELGINGESIIEEVDPNYLFWIGDRDLELRDGWEIFFDRVPTRPYSVEKGYLIPESVNVSTEGGRATIEIEGLSSTNFAGSLAFILYHDSPFVHMEARVSTERPATAFLYHVGLAKPETEGHHVEWFDAHDNPHIDPILNSTASVYKTRYRSLALSNTNGSLVISPFPHQYLYPLDFADNYGYNWAGAEYLDMIDGFAFGVRQPPMGDRRFVPWVNAQPSSVQKLGVLLFLSEQSGLDNLEIVKRYTRSDSFKALEGYKTLSSHYHHEHSMDFINMQQEQNTIGVPAGLEDPDFVNFFKRMGVDMVHMAEFHFGRTPGTETDQRLAELKVMHDEFARLSGDDFLLIPGEEPNVHLNSHWLSMFPKPVYWVLNQNQGQPFVQDIPGYGTVYHVGSADDVLNLLEQEDGLAWTAHPRVKGSTGFPDGYNDQDFFLSEHFLGGAWKAMPADYSREMLGWRVLDLEDDMANWGARKYILGEVDIFKIYEDYELFGTMNINYLRLDEIPDYEDGWQPVVDALANGKFFVTTGEVLIVDFSVEGMESGETINKNESAKLIADLEWTYPLSYMEIISGDGTTIYRDRIDLSHTTEFDSETIDRNMDLSNRSWVRIEVWDIARNGAFTQPVWIEN
ncbi:MAG: hypothetical protein CM1200mP40_03420 [Gammaproteobacteria bacterium]|nr:MAG: hypothetical protein CM1200mP40_03420 [Gammaproteobacteria bacterium]